MALRIGDEAPDFTAQTTQGPIQFHDWIGNGWAILFSHPKDFTPVCTTELGYMARLKPEFDKRNTKIIGLSIDSVGDHERWANDIKETQGTAPNYPLIGDSDLNVAKLYDMIHPNASGEAKSRTAADSTRANWRNSPTRRGPLTRRRRSGAPRARRSWLRRRAACSPCHRRPWSPRSHRPTGPGTRNCAGKSRSSTATSRGRCPWRWVCRTPRRRRRLSC